MAAPSVSGPRNGADGRRPHVCCGVRQFPKFEQAAAATGSAAREFSRLALRRALNQLVTMELTARGAARRQLSWSDSATLRYPADGFEDQLGPALDAAVADQPDTESLRTLVLAPRRLVVRPSP
ncbi:hypothetical protein [Streptomyces sp. NPDC049555]|uniref:hypothetical protein n=1 Tax=unclassified Streptomyces TaxID=2593676 RepID=UPI0034183F02